MQLSRRQSHGRAADAEDGGDLRHGLDQTEELLQSGAIADEVIEMCNHREIPGILGSWGAGVERGVC